MAAPRFLPSRVARHPLSFAMAGVALASMAMLNGWAGDDFFIRRRLVEWDLSRILMDLFVLPGGRPGQLRQAIEGSGFPWWADPALHVSFWRPVSALSHWVDARLMPDSAVFAHAHSLVWVGVLVALVTRLYQRVWGPGVAAALAALCYLADDGRGVAVGWVASRNALIAGALGVAALLQHRRWRRDGVRWAALGAPLTLALALAAGESAVGALAYLVAYAVCLDRGAPRARAASVLPYVGLVVGWRALYQHLGYGTVGSTFYADPGREPLRFVEAVLERAPVLLLRQWGVRPAEAYPAMHAADQLWVLGAAVLFLAVVALALAPLVRRDRTARFFALGMLLAVVPCCATIPQGRLLTFVGIGAAGLLARWVERLWWRPARWMPASRVWRVPAHVFAGLLLASNLVVAPLTLRWTLWEVVDFYPDLEQRALSIPEPDCALGRHVILVQGGLPVGFFYADIRALEGVTPPERLLVMAPDAVVRVTRVDERTLNVRPRNGFLAPSNTGDWHENAARMFETFVRVGRRPLALHDRVDLDGVTVEVTRLDGAGRAVEATFRFAVPLDDPSLRWFARRGPRYVRFVPPAVGRSARLAPSDA